MADSTKERVLAKIRSGSVHMRPRFVFAARTISILVVAALALLTSTLVVSFMFFSLHESGELFLLGFGNRGVLTFLTLFPWFLLVLAVVLIVLLDALLRYFAVGYRRPLLVIFFITLIGVGILGAIVSATPFHPTLFQEANHDRLPLFSGLYKDIRSAHRERGEFKGVVTSIGTSTIGILFNDRDTDTDDGEKTVIPPPGFPLSTLVVGDEVYVAGDTATNTIRAYGIHTAPQEDTFRK